MDNAALIGSIAATLGVLSSTGFFVMNSTINYLAMPVLLLGSPIRADPATDRATLLSTLLGEPRASRHPRASPTAIVPSTPEPATPVPHLTRQWAEVYWRGFRWGPVSAAISAGCFLTAAWCTRPSDAVERFLVDVAPRTGLYVAAAAAACFAGPYTWIVMVPGANDELHARSHRVAARDGLGSAEAGEGKASVVSGPALLDDERETVRLIRKWTAYSEVRAASGAVAALLGLVAQYV